MKRAVIGAGGFGREIKAVLGEPDIKFFVDDIYEDLTNNIIGLSKFNPEEYKVVVAVANPKDRYDIIQRLPSSTKYFTFIDPSVQIHGNDVEVGEGSIICAGTIITTNVKIGKHAHLNLITTIGHDCVIGDYFTTAPGVQISGNETIGDRVYFGTRSCIKEKLTVCNDVVVGMNAGVVSNIIEPGVYVGTPAKRVK